METRQTVGGVGVGRVGGVGGEAGLAGGVGLEHKAAGVCWPNNSVEPTALSRRLARKDLPATGVVGEVVLHRSRGGSPRGR